MSAGRRSLREALADLRANPRRPGSCDECGGPTVAHYVAFDERREVLSVRLRCAAHRDDGLFVDGSRYELVTPENYLAMVVMETVWDD